MGGVRKETRLPSISKNTILRDRINDAQVLLAKRAPLMVRNPKKREKEGDRDHDLLLGR